MGAMTKVGLVLLSPSSDPVPSTRVAILNLLPLLREAGFDAVPLHDPPASDERPALRLSAAEIAAQGVRVVIFQKVRGPDVERTARELAAAGVATVFMVCDIVEPAMVAACDATVIVTDHLRSLYPAASRPRMHVVHDGIEEPDRVVAAYRATRGARADPLRAVLVTSAHLSRLPSMGTVPAWLQVRVIGHYPPPPSALAALRNVEWRARHAGGLREALETWYFAAAPHIRCVQWGPTLVYEEMAAADIGVLPIDDRDRGDATRPAGWTVKSENRLTLMMSMGLPVIATPIPAYERVVEHGVNAMFASSRADWQRCLRELRDPERRRAMGTAARASVHGRFSKQRQCALLADVLRGVLSRPGAPAGSPGT
jgi:hypothetical protein